MAAPHSDSVPGPPPVRRRTFLDLVLGAGLCSTAASVFYPVWRFACAQDCWTKRIRASG